MNATDLKLALTSSLLEEFPLAEGDEIEAVVTHWMHAPHGAVPFLTESMRQHCWEIAHDSKAPTARAGVGEKVGRFDGQLKLDWNDTPFPPPTAANFTFIDLFAGIGGFRLAMQASGGKCVFSSEWDAQAKRTYEANFGEVPFGDIRKIDENSIPDHDVLCAGFPCQPFSLAGVSARNALNTAHGFACETQGTLFFDIARIVEAKRPKVLFLENVKNLVSHDGGKTFAVIRSTIESLGYTFYSKLIDSSSLVPQRRVRCYMVAVRSDVAASFEFPVIAGDPLPLSSILEPVVDPSFTISSRLWAGHRRRTDRNLERGTGFTAVKADVTKPANTIVARYGKDGKECLVPQGRRNPRMLTPRECARLQGFPEGFVIPAAKTVAYRQFGNSVAVPVIERIGERIALMIEATRESM